MTRACPALCCAPNIVGVRPHHDVRVVCLRHDARVSMSDAINTTCPARNAAK
jgi:hypothetical protein